MHDANRSEPDAHSTPPTTRWLFAAILLGAGACGRTAVEEDAAEPTISATAILAPAGPEVTVNQTTTQLTYIIQEGDSLSGVADRFGVSVRALADFNAISDVHAVKVGQELSIPPATTTSIVGG